MNLQISDKFVGLRDLSIIWLTRASEAPVDQVLSIPRDQLLIAENEVLVGDFFIPKAPETFLEYIHTRDRHFQQAAMLFPTKDGQRYAPSKFKKRLKSLFENARISNPSNTPADLTPAEYQALQNLRFAIQRPCYQSKLAVALCVYLGLRPSEVAKLIKEDLDFGNRAIRLRDTKSQENQVLPMLALFVEPLQRYVTHLPADRDPLFICSAGTIWTRRHVNHAIAEWGKEQGYTRRLTPRILRASLGAMLSRARVEPALIAKILRHRDPATALRHYNFREIEEARTVLEDLSNLSHATENATYIQEFQKYYDQLEGEE